MKRLGAGVGGRMPASPTIRRGRSPKSLGQSLVEFALVIPIALVILGGALDMGRLFFARVTIENSAREGAFFGSTNPVCDTAARAGCDDPGTADWHVRNEADSLSGLSTTFRCIQGGLPVSVTDCQGGDVYEASVTSTFDFVTPILEPIFGGSMQLEATAYSTVFNKAYDPAATPFPMPTPTPEPTRWCAVPQMVTSPRLTVVQAEGVWTQGGTLFVAANFSAPGMKKNDKVGGQSVEPETLLPCLTGTVEVRK